MSHQKILSRQSLKNARSDVTKMFVRMPIPQNYRFAQLLPLFEGSIPPMLEKPPNSLKVSKSNVALASSVDRYSEILICFSDFQ
ncbi:hypothetical protein M0R45_005553 [Rubus argutus]|uniref:Uncharacterized protein n=1 Tax=Rubus argutus TaxID=59490 RepID=A0AAW1YNH7_RUBAR